MEGKEETDMERTKGGVHKTKRVIVVLEKAGLETVKTKKGYELVSADTHASILKKYKKTASQYRPDIVHQCLLTLLDSPLNKAGHLQVYIHTDQNVLIEVSPHLRIPRTYKRFAGLMVQLLHKLKIRASNGPQVLMKVIRNPITDHLPAGAPKIALSGEGELLNVRTQVCPTLPENLPVVFMCGSHAHGDEEVDWTERKISISKYPLSASVALSRLTHSFEEHWGIL
eukprot:g34403.t1